MDMMGLLIPVLSGSPQLKSRVQTLFGQPVEHVSKCVSQFMDQIKSGPGLIDQQAQRQQRFMHIYNSGLRMGFQDWQAQIAAADCAGYPIIDVANSFAQRRGWNVTIQEIQELHAKVMPKFMELGKKTGLFQAQKPVQKQGIPSVQVNTAVKEPPWRTAASPVKGAPDPALK